jgi:hypothetical protein
MITVEDRLEILELCARYNYFTDTGDAQEVARLFTSDGVFDGPPGRFEGFDAIVAFNENIYQALAGSMHFTDNHLFESRDSFIRHRCYLALNIPSKDGVKPTLMMYDDEVVKVEGEWKFRARTVRAFEPKT